MAVKTEDTQDIASGENAPKDSELQKANEEFIKAEEEGKTAEIPIVRDLHDVVEKFIKGS